MAQWIRHRPTEPGIAGSSPAGVMHLAVPLASQCAGPLCPVCWPSRCRPLPGIAACETPPFSSIWSRGVTVSTLDSESSDRGSNPRETFFPRRSASSRPQRTGNDIGDDSEDDKDADGGGDGDHDEEGFDFRSQRVCRAYRCKLVRTVAGEVCRSGAIQDVAALCRRRRQIVSGAKASVNQ